MDIFKLQGLGQTKPLPSPLFAHPFPFNHLVSSLNPLGSSSPKKPWGTSLPPPPPSRTKFSDKLLVFLKFLKNMHIAYTNLHREPDNSGM